MRLISIKNQIEFDKVFDNGKRYNGALLTAIIVGTSGLNKLGIIVNRKFGGSVVRNRIKRKIREAFRAATEKISSGIELVVMPKAPAKKAKTPEILTDLSSIIHRAGIT